jgi:hypothetical protein
MTKGLLCWFVLLLGCSSPAMARDPKREPLHDSCLHSCQNVRKIPICPAEALSGPVHSPTRLIELAAQMDGQVVRVRGRLGKAEGLWSQINCPKDICCSSQLDPFVSIHDKAVELALSGQFRLAGAAPEKLSCLSVGGAMIQSYSASAAAPLVFTRWNRRRDGEPDPELLQRAYCCNLDARGQQAIVAATFVRSEREFAPHRLTNPLVCELPAATK